MISGIALGMCAIAGVVWSAWCVERSVWMPSPIADRAVRFGVIATALVIAVMLPLGAAGHLSLPSVLLVELCACAVSFALARPVTVDSSETPAARSSPIPLGFAGAIVALAIPFAVTHAPFTLYDSISYHLFFAARWVQDHAIAIIPTPFSDVAQAYAPGNGELVFAWLMLPLHSDLLARMGQLPFAILAAAAVTAIAWRLGAEGAHLLYPAAFMLLSRPVAEQMVGANVDLICAALFAASIYLLIVASATNAIRDWVVAGAAAGLYLGTKYLALVYLPMLLVFAVFPRPRMRALWAVPGVFAFGLPWYARNWIVAGSPIYPASVAPLGVTVARGAFTRSAMLNTVFHTTDLRLVPAIAAHAFGPPLFVVWVPLMIMGGLAMARRGWWPHRALVLAPFVMAVLFWIGLPVNVDSRFLLPAIPLALVPLAFASSADRRIDTVWHVVKGTALVWLAIGAAGSLPATVPWFMNGWLSLRGIVSPAHVVPFVASAAAIGVTWQLSRSTRYRVVLAAAVFLLCVAESAFSGGDSIDTTKTYVRSGYEESWRWIARNIQGATIAYTGINLPYPLTGPNLSNRVVYVNIDGRARWRFHDYDRAYRSGRWTPHTPLLASSSGELLPVAARSGPRDDALRPRYERMQGLPDAWTFNLDTLNVRYLYVAILSAYEIDYVWHNDRGFPIEDEWAQADPSRFQLVYTNPQVHIYAVDLGKKARA